MKHTYLIYLLAIVCFLTICIDYNYAFNIEGLKKIPGIGNEKSTTTKSKKSETNSFSAVTNAFSKFTKEETLEDELKVGRIFASQILGTARLYPDAAIQEYVNLVGRNIANHSERNNLPWVFGVIDTTSINAFAAPGGYILLTKGLFEILETEDELSFVLAHEIAHVVSKHHYNIIRQQETIQFGATAVSSSSDSLLADKISNLVGQMLARGLDQSAEYEADRDGMVLAARAVYDSSALITVLDKLENLKNRDHSAMELMFATHPQPKDRKNAIHNSLTLEIEDAAIESYSANRIRFYNRKK